VDSAYVLDSYAMIAHFEDEAGGEQVRKVLKAAHAGKTKLYMSVINLGEIYYNTYRERGPQKADEAVFLMRQLPVTLVNADMEITIKIVLFRFFRTEIHNRLPDRYRQGFSLI